MRRLTATLVALATLAVPGVAAAQSAGDQGCAALCTGPTDVIRCWWPQRGGWTPDGAPPDVVRRQRADGTWEVQVGTDRFHDGERCVEVIPGSGVYVLDVEVPGVLAYLKGRYLAETGQAELFGELVPATLLNGTWAQLIRCEVRGQAARFDAGLPSDVWHGHRDGALQIIPSTWRAFGGLEYARFAGEARAAEQVAVATAVMDDGGLRPWSCRRSVR